MRPLLLAVALAVLAAPALAADAAYAYPGASLGGRLTYFRADDGDDGSWGPGAQARWTFNSRAAVEASGDYLRQKFPDTTAHTGAFQASLLYYFLRRQVSPFILGGGGLYLTRVNGPNYRRNTSRFGPHLGAGLQFWATPRWSLDATYRYAWVDDLDTRDGSGAMRAYRRSGSMFTVAANMHFEPSK